MPASDTVKFGVSIVASIAVIAAAAIAAVGYHGHQRDLLMSKDIQVAMEKGINPIVIRCAYASEQDRICLVYAATRGTPPQVEYKPTK